MILPEFDKLFAWKPSQSQPTVARNRCEVAINFELALSAASDWAEIRRTEQKADPNGTNVLVSPEEPVDKDKLRWSKDLPARPAGRLSGIVKTSLSAAEARLHRRAMD